jgi:hypothetical protein
LIVRLADPATNKNGPRAVFSWIFSIFLAFSAYG